MQPLPDESESAYIVRYHKVMAPTIRDTDARQRAAVAAWRSGQAAPSKLDQRVAEQFPDEEFVHRLDVPVFEEHATVGRDGVPVRYDRAALQAIVDRCNSRISDTGNFAALSYGHTPEREEMAKGAKIPELAGFAGPFRMGMVGADRPRWAIFQDEHYYRDEAGKVKKYPRRSPEVWLEPRMEDRFFDPVAVLGAEAPRLDMGMRCCRTASGKLIEKYSATFPGGADTCAPAEVTIPREKHSADQSQEAGSMALSPEDLQQIVSAIQQTEVFQWAAAKMQEDQATPDADDGMGGGMPDAGAPDAAAPPAPGTPPGAPPVDKNAADNAPPVTPPTPSTPPGIPPMNPMEHQQKYSRLEAENRATKAMLANMEQRLAKAEKEKRTSERYSRLTTAAQAHVLDVDAEMKRAEKMTDEAFDDHMQVVIEHYERIPVNIGAGAIYVPDNVAGEKPMTDKYRKDCSRKAVDFVAAERAAGRNTTFEAALKKAFDGEI